MSDKSALHISKNPCNIHDNRNRLPAEMVLRIEMKKMQNWIRRRGERKTLYLSGLEGSRSLTQLSYSTLGH